MAVVYVAYLVLISFLRPAFGKNRPALVASSLLLVGLVFLDAVVHPGRVLSLVVIPSLALLVGYRMSGLLFVRVDEGAELWLRRSDDRWLQQSGLLAGYERAPAIVREYFELAYLLVYAALPAGAVVLLTAGESDAAARYWNVVLLADFFCYAMLPLIQTRPPMVLERDSHRPPASGHVRRFNPMIAARGSIQAATIPSGHAAGALASALAIGSVLPVAGAVFLVLAISIAVASVLGRYHYAADAVLGFGVAAVAWLVV